ncbi:MAG: sensor histidine kinase, partial [Sediminispirochaetaceae bacterium]
MNINNTVADIDQYYQYLLSNRLVLAGIQNERFGIDSETYESVVYLKDLMFSLITSNEELNAAIYISKKGTSIASTSGIILPEIFRSSVFPTLPEVERIYREPTEALWYLNEFVDPEHVYYMRGITNPASGEILGILSFAVKTRIFKDQIKSLAIPDGGVYFCSSSGRIIFSTNPSLEGELFPYFNRIRGSGLSQTFEEEKKLYITSATRNSWIVISEVPAASLYKNTNVIIRWGIFIALVCLIAGTFLSVIISRMYTRDLTILVQVMEASARGRLERITIPGSNVEFRSLGNTYNTMIQNLEQLTADLKKEISEKSAAEQALLELNETLEQKVTERTAQLRDSLKALRQAQKHLIEKEKMASLGTLVSGIAHEINNPLNYITTGIAALGKVLNKDTQDPLVVELFENIRIGAERTSEIVGGLRKYAGKDNEEYTEFHIHDCIELALKLLYNEYKQGITIYKHFD